MKLSEISFDKTEIAWIIIALIIFEFLIIFPLTAYNPLILLTPIVILAVNLITKKIAAQFFNIQIKYKIWEFQRYGWYEKSKFKKPFPIGLILPLIISLMSLGFVKIPLLLQFNYKNLKNKRLLHRSGLERRTEINESDPANTAFWGFFSLLILSVIGFIPIIEFIFPKLQLYSLIYILFNLIPFGNLDGSRLFFGSKIAWFLALILSIIFLALVLVY